MNSRIICRDIKGGKREEKEIYELTDIDRQKYKLIGRAVGVNMNHCLAMAHKRAKQFWHRVYGYQIVKDDDLLQKIVTSMKEKGMKQTEYMAVYFYERKSEEQYMFIPNRLDVNERPELSSFPLNILFGTATIMDNGKKRVETAPYVPDLDTFTDVDGKQTMQYFNKFDGSKRHRVEIAYNTGDKSYVGTKYRDDKQVGMAFGTIWEPFFAHLTMLGVGDDIEHEANSGPR